MSLKEIKVVWEGHWGKGYWRNWYWKLLHVCMKCGKAKGWRGKLDSEILKCSTCKHPVTWKEWMNLKRKALWQYLGSDKKD